jgi:hypothetical protein
VAASAMQGPDLGVARGVPLSAPWSCLAIGLAQSWDIMAPPMGMEALAAGGVWAEAAMAAEAKSAETKSVRIVVMTRNSRRMDAMVSRDRLAMGEAGSNKKRSPSIAFTTGRWQTANVGRALVRAAATAVCQCQAL